MLSIPNGKSAGLDHLYNPNPLNKSNKQCIFGLSKPRIKLTLKHYFKVKNRILVTGGAGFIGSQLVSKLLSDNNSQVSVVDNFNDFYSPQSKRENIGSFIGNADFSLFETDICDPAGLREVFENRQFDSIIHLAARAGVRPSLEAPGLYAETNISGTLNLLEYAREFEVPKFVFGSSSSVYGERSKIPFSEGDDINHPISPYAATKVAGEALCHTFSHLYGINTVCLRFFTVYGARQRPDLAIHKFARLMKEEKPIPVFGDGTTRRDYTYIDDIVQGICAAVNYDKTQYEIFNLGESKTVELRELISLLEESLGTKADIKRLPEQPGDVPLTCADISKARDLLGYDPKVQIEEGIKRFTKWFLEREKSTPAP